MKKSSRVTLFSILLLLGATAVFLLPDDAWAGRFGGGSSVGSRGSKSFSTPRQATPRNATQPSPSHQQTASASPTGSRWGSGLLGGIGGFMLGGLLGSMLFGGAGESGGLGFLEILLIGGALYWLFRWFKGRQAGAPVPESGNAAFSPACGNQGAPATMPPVSNRISLNKSPLPHSFSMGGAGPVDEVSQGLSQIAGMDPGFNEMQFLAGAKSAYQQIQSAWSDWSVERLRPLLTERMWDIIQSQARERQAAGRRDIVEKIRFDVAEISEAWQEAGENWLTVHFLVDMVEYETDVAGRILNGTPDQSIKVEEYWTFCRPVGSPNPNWLLSAVQQPGEVARSIQ
ncbi:MAG: Tim44 domain-containing protein [Magnetococcales bacterium]|nr:Tim44 domain-containing protein [Magnetococcales bacterium]